MPAASLLTLVDDVVVLLDDVWLMTKVSAQKSSGILGDDLALNAQQVSDLTPERELPVIGAVALGSLKNKAILVPAALLLRALAPGLIGPLLLVGGLFLCHEGAEKLYHKLFGVALGVGVGDGHLPAHSPGLPTGPNEQERIAGAVRTDFILSAEIVALTLALVQKATLLQATLVLIAIGVLMTIGVYGTVALIVKLDDIGLRLSRAKGSLWQQLGLAMLWFAPRLLTTISVVGTAAVFSVGGGILVHGIPPLHHALEGNAVFQSSLGGLAIEFFLGLSAGMLTTLMLKFFERFRGEADVRPQGWANIG